MPSIKILYFAHIAEKLGRRDETRELETGTTAKGLRESLAAEFPDLKDGLANCRIAINEEFAADEDEIPEGATVAIIPPVSGG